ncbi:hypothetical protein OJ996_25530 [Luteolibacter sp. GHJ8]|uniref:Uncharacterized protein n=1 Tax=Luteolibacter rhizosphaerae TaxID=2989719 RepID=A0ABT3GAW0_9BACT|nr:hypothetical protein [Luteolibacter rhizosphaerae]MCW1916976.1 hypothetical protein [Luteolibacter rhizosphaerae]
MTDYYELRIEVPGHIGMRSVVDRGARPPIVSSLHFVFDGWGGDEILTSFPVFLVTESLAATFSERGFTGAEMGSVEVEKSRQISVLQPLCELPKFLWLKVTGDHKDADFFITRNQHLGVSPRALAAILETNPQTLRYRLYDEGTSSREWN